MLHNIYIYIKLFIDVLFNAVVRIIRGSMKHEISYLSYTCNENDIPKLTIGLKV